MSYTRRRKTSLLIVAILTIALAQAHVLYAGGYEWGGLGTRAQAMGGAFIGLADDWTAIYWNPAGLTQLKGAGFGFDFSSPHIQMNDGNSIANPPAAAVDIQFQRDPFVAHVPGELARFSKEKVRYDFYIPAGAAGYWQCAGLNMAFGYYVPSGYFIDWDDQIPFAGGSIAADLFQELSVIALNFSLAKQITSALSVGAGLDVLLGEVDYEANKVLAGTPSDYAFAVDSSSDGTGYEGVFGALYHVDEKLSIGAVYRTGGTIDLDGRATSSLTLIPLSEASGFVQKFHHPATYGIGAAYRHQTNLIFTADFQRTDWSSFDIDVDYDTPGTLLFNQDYSADWHDSNRYRVGTEWRPALRWALRAGYFFDESPLPGKSVSLSNIVGVDRHNVMLGAGYEFCDAWFLDLILHHAWGDREVADVDYRQRVYSFGLSLSHQF